MKPRDEARRQQPEGQQPKQERAHFGSALHAMRDKKEGQSGSLGA